MIIDIIFISLIGACVGSFLNVCICRWPDEKSVVSPASHCVKCGKSILWHDNIPLVSYWVLGGKCRFCGEKFSMRYFWIELLTALVFAGFYFYSGWSAVTAAYLTLACCFLVTVFTDFDRRIIPDEVTIGGMFAGLVFSFFIPALHDVTARGSWLQMHVMSLGWSAFGALVGGGIIYLLAEIGDLIFKGVVDKSFLKEISSRPEELFEDLVKGGYLKKRGYITSRFTRLKNHSEMTLSPSFESDKEKIFLLVKDCLGTMGGGDIKLMAMIGAFLGWEKAILTFLIAPFFGIIVGGIQKLRTGNSTFPYGPYLVLAALIALFFGDSLIPWLLNQYGWTPDYDPMIQSSFLPR